MLVVLLMMVLLMTVRLMLVTREIYGVGGPQA